MPQNNKMIFPGDYTPIRKVILQDAKISEPTQEKVDSWKGLQTLHHPFSSDVGYMKLIEMNIESDPNLPPLLQNHTHLLLNIMNGSEKG